MLVFFVGWLWVPTTLLAAFGADLRSQIREFGWAWNQWTGLKQPYIGFFSFVPMDIYPTAHYMWPSNSHVSDRPAQCGTHCVLWRDGHVCEASDRLKRCRYRDVGCPADAVRRVLLRCRRQSIPEPALDRKNGNGFRRSPTGRRIGSIPDSAVLYGLPAGRVFHYLHHQIAAVRVLVRLVVQRLV